jgi:hypothetical protein
MRNATGRLPGSSALACAAALVAALVAPARAADPDVRLEASVDRDELPLGERLTLRVRLEAPERPTALELPGEGQLFHVVSRAQSTSSSFTAGGGGMRLGHTVTWQLGLEPVREGTLTIGPVAVVVGGKRHEADAIAVAVLPRGATPGLAGPAPGPGLGAPGSPPRGATPVWRGWERDLAYETVVDRREVFLGEPVTLSSWILSPIDLVGLDETVPPTFEGFWVEELERPQRLRYEIREVNGIPVRAYLVRRAALFPARAGTLTVPPVEVELAVRLGTDSPFDPFPEVRRARRRTQPVAIRVKPLPPGAPTRFQSMNVGTFTLSLETDRATVPVGEPVTVRVIASGAGNLRALALPRLPSIAGAKSFDPVVKERIVPGGPGLRGERVLETVLVPERTGELVIPALEWPYFDPRSGRYETARTAERRVEVTAGAASGVPVAASNALDAGLRPIRADLSIGRSGSPPWATPLFAGAVLAPVLLFLGVVVTDRARDRLRAGEGARRVRHAGRGARRRLAAARRLLRAGDPERFFAEVERALTGYASDRLGASALGLTRRELEEALAEAGAHPPATRALAAALDLCDAARFGRGAAERTEILATAERALELLEEADWTRAEVRA